MANERQTVLADQDYQELIARRVYDSIRAEKIVTRRWRIGIGITFIVGVVTILAMWYLDLIDLRGEVYEIVSDAGPTVNGIDTQFSDLDRLEIVGLGFGGSFGQVELYYEPAGEFCRSSTLLLDPDDQNITAWSGERIIARLKDEQKQEIIASLFANCSETPFDRQQPIPDALHNPEILDALVPYISVITSERRRSPVW